MSPEDLSKFKQLYKEGLSVAAIARLTNFSPTAVNYRLKTLSLSTKRPPGIKPRTAFNALSQEQIDNIVMHWKQGLTIPEVSVQTGHGKSTINRYLRSLGLYEFRTSYVRKPQLKLLTNEELWG